MAVAHAIARRSVCVRDQVGAVITDPRNRIVAVGYNGSPAGMPYGGRPCDHWCPRTQPGSNLDPGYTDCFSLHAESNALSVCDRSLREGGTIYITSGSCFGCAKLIANSGLVRVVIGVDDRDWSHRGLDRSYSFMRASGLEVVGATG